MCDKNNIFMNKTSYRIINKSTKMQQAKPQQTIAIDEFCIT